MSKHVDTEGVHIFSYNISESPDISLLGVKMCLHIIRNIHIIRKTILTGSNTQQWYIE